MKFLFQLLGIGLILLGIYFLGKNIFFTTDAYPYFWKGIAADFSVLTLTCGVSSLFLLPRTLKFSGWILIFVGIISVFYSGRVILQPTSLWQFFVSICSILGGFKLLMDRNFGG